MSIPTIFHKDVYVPNFVTNNSTLVIKLNDFNSTRFLWHNKKNGGSCGYVKRNVKSCNIKTPPEECEGLDVFEKGDIYQYGNILRHIITEDRHKVPTIQLVNSTDVRADLMSLNKDARQIPKKYLKKSDTALETIFEMMDRCLSFDPSQRPNAKEIVNDLDRSIQLISSKIDESGNVDLKEALDVLLRNKVPNEAIDLPPGF